MSSTNLYAAFKFFLSDFLESSKAGAWSLGGSVQGSNLLPRKLVFALNLDGYQSHYAAGPRSRSFVMAKLFVGIHGNTHFAFSDLNNLQVANLLSKYLHENRLDKR